MNDNALGSKEIDEDFVDFMATLCSVAHLYAVGNGFYDTHDRLIAHLDVMAESSGTLERADEFRAMLADVKQHQVLSKHALVNTELGEMSEGTRKPGEADHIGPSFFGTGDGENCGPNPPFTQEEEEAADVIIRMCDLAGFRKLRLGEAIVAKMIYNRTRPPKHGKNS